MKHIKEIHPKKLSQIEKLVTEALYILSALGVPILNLSKRRKDLLLPVEAGIVLKSAAKPDANTNDGTRGYALNPDFAKQIRSFGSPEWGKNLPNFINKNITLAQELHRNRDLARIPVTFNGDKKIFFSPGQHNQLQKRIIEDFLPNYGYGAEVLYVGDSADKYLYIDEIRLRDLNFFEIAHDKLPDVIAYSALKNWLYLIEAVHTANPITEIRRLILLRLTRKCTASIIFVTAFPNRDLFRKHSKDIAWETEVWIAESPEHLIHFNGDKFLGPYLGD